MQTIPKLTQLFMTASVLALSAACGPPPECKPPPPPDVSATPPNQCKPTPGNFDWPSGPSDVQKDEEWAVFDAKAAFAGLPGDLQKKLLTDFQAALDKENNLDLAYISSVNAAIAAGKSDFNTMIADIDAAVQDLIAFLSKNGATNDQLVEANKKQADIQAHHQP